MSNSGQPESEPFGSAARVTRGDLPESVTSVAPSGAARSVQAEPEGAADGELVRSGRPVRGFVWGLMLGLGLAIVATVTQTITFEPVPALLVVAAGIAVGVLWSILGPAKR